MPPTQQVLPPPLPQPTDPAPGGPAGSVPVAGRAPFVPPPPGQGLANVLGFVGAAITALGVGFLLWSDERAMSLDTVTRAWAVGALAVLLVVLSFVIRRLWPGNIGAAALLVTGVVVADVDLLTTVPRADLPPGLALGLAVLVLVVGLGITVWWRSQALAVIMLVVGLSMIPWITQLRTVEVGLFVLLAAVAAVVLQWFKDWEGPSTAALGLGGCLLWFGSISQGGELWRLIVELVLLLGVTLVSAAMRQKEGLTPIVSPAPLVLPGVGVVPAEGMWVVDPMGQRRFVQPPRPRDPRTVVDQSDVLGAMALVTPAIALTIALSAQAVRDSLVTAAGGFLAAALLVVAILLGEVRRRWVLGPLTTFVATGCSAGAMVLASVALLGHDGEQLDPILAVQMLAVIVLCGLGMVVRSKPVVLAIWVGLLWSVPSLLRVLGLVLTTAGERGGHAPDAVTVIAVALGLVALVVLVVATHRASTSGPVPRRWAWTDLLAAPLAALLLCGLAVAGGSVVGGAAGARVGQVVATVLLLVTGAVLLWRSLGETRGPSVPAWRVLGGFFLLSGAAKLVLVDMAGLSALLRVVAFIGAGVALIVIGAVYAQALGRKARSADSGQ